MYLLNLLTIGIDLSFDGFDHIRLGLGNRHLLDTLDIVKSLRLDFRRRARNRVKTGFRSLDILAGHHIHRADRMLQQALAGGAEQ